MRLDQPGDPYRCCLCARRSRAHLCRGCWNRHADPDTGQLPEWVRSLQREAGKYTMREYRAFKAGFIVDINGHDGDGDTLLDDDDTQHGDGLDPASVDWEAVVHLLVDERLTAVW